MKKLFYVFGILVIMVALIGCNNSGGQTTNETTNAVTTTTIQNSDLTERLHSIYELAVTSDAFSGTYEEWLETVRGPQGIPGEDGREVLLQVAGGYIQWQYTGDTSWNDLIDLASLTGATGADGKEVIFQVADGYIKWQYVGDTDWTNLIEISTLTGVQGVGISDTSIDQYGHLIITYTDNSVVDIGQIYVFYTVNFVGMGGYLIDTQTVGYGDDAIAPTPPSVAGYTFNNWDTDFTNITSNVTVKAVYTADAYTINFDTNGGASIDPITDIVYGSTVTLPIPIKDGYEFKGWFSGTGVNDGQFTNLSEVKQDITLYAKWSINTYNITYYLDGGTNGSNPDTYTVETDTITLANPTKTGYTFEGWYDNASYTGDPITEIALGTAGDITLYANWNINQYDISYYMFDSDYNPLEDISLHAGEKIIQVSLGDFQSSALTSKGRVFTWGNNGYGQLGDGTTTDSYSPIEITNQFNLNAGETITQVSLGDLHSSAITTEGRVFTWGHNGFGQLGDGTTTDKNTPIDITSQFGLNAGETIIQVSLGAYQSSAITSEGRIFTWGRNDFGQLGDGTTTDRYTPIDISSQFSLNAEETIIQISLGFYHSTALTSESRVFSWGRNQYGQLGDGTTTDSSSPIEITNQFNLNAGETITQVSLGYYHSSALTSEGRAFTWGQNYYGQLGDGTTTNIYNPFDITSQFGLSAGETTIQVSLGAYHSSAITSEGRVFRWGSNNYGQLGDGTTTNRYTPIDISSQFSLNAEETIIQISLGYYHSSALTSEGRVFTWGRNLYGQLGDGTTTDSYTPIKPNLYYPSLINIDSYDYGATITEFVPTRAGYTFGGWYTDEALTQEFTLSVIPAEDITLYAQWIIN